MSGLLGLIVVKAGPHAYQVAEVEYTYVKGTVYRMVGRPYRTLSEALDELQRRSGPQLGV